MRQAFVHAVDRAALADTTGSSNTPATGGFVPPGLSGYSAGIGLPYDPARAQQLLAEAGYSDSSMFPTLEGYYWSEGIREHASQVLEQQWRDVLGIRLQWKYLPWEEWRDRRLQQTTHLVVNAWIADYPDPHNFLNVAVHLFAPWWRNADYEHLLDVAEHMTDQTERVKAYRSAEQILMREAAIIPLTYGRTQLLVKPWVKRYPISSLSTDYWKDVVIEPH